MKVNRQKAARKLIDYLQHRITLTELVKWAESMMMEADFDEQNLEIIREVVGRVGLSDVREFGMSWKDCEDFPYSSLFYLKYNIQIKNEEFNS